MNLHNRPFPTETEKEQPDAVFNTLQVGSSFNGGQLIQSRTETSLTVRRADGWLVTVNVGDWAWGRLVKLEKK